MSAATDPAVPYRRPADVPHDANPTGLLMQLHRHRLAQLDSRLDYGDPLSPADRAAHALGELAVTEALVDQLRRGRWVVVVEALEAGARIADVAAATGLGVDELRAGVCTWIDGQSWLHGECDGRLGLSPARADAVRGLVSS